MSARGKGTALPPYPRITFLNQDGERKGHMQNYVERGYYVKENSPVYFTRDMERTHKWFRDVLGWYGDIAGRDEDGTPHYGCVTDCPGELIVAQLTPFRGIHMFRGEPTKGVACFIRVQGLERLRQLVLDNGWEQITEIKPQPWGADECQVTTVDGSRIRFFEIT